MEAASFSAIKDVIFCSILAAEDTNVGSEILDALFLPTRSSRGRRRRGRRLLLIKFLFALIRKPDKPKNANETFHRPRTNGSRSIGVVFIRPVSSRLSSPVESLRPRRRIDATTRRSPNEQNLNEIEWEQSLFEIYPYSHSIDVTGARGLWQSPTIVIVKIRQFSINNVRLSATN